MAGNNQMKFSRYTFFLFITLILSIKTHANSEAFTPYIGPYLTLLQPTPLKSDGTATVLNPETSMVINYELKARPKNYIGAVRFRKLDGEWQLQQEDDYKPIQELVGKVHHITLTGLSSNTVYEYQVVGPQNTYGKTYRFETAANALDSSRFLVVGDMQDEQQKQRWQDVANAIVEDHLDDFDFIITVGDMVKDDIPESGERFYWWRVFFSKGEALFASKPIFPALGNHDTPAHPEIADFRHYSSNPEDTLSFRKYFYLNTDMSKPDYYSFQYGNACLLSVNSEIPVFYGRYPERDKSQRVKEQANWLEQAVTQASQCPWSFAYWHVPPINPAGGKNEVKYLRPYANFFNQKLDWSITGHVHEYQRVKPLQAYTDRFDFKERYGRDRQQGVGYLIAPPAGQWPRDNTSDQMNQLAFYPHNQYGVAYEVGFTIVQTQANNIEIKTYGMGDVSDRPQPKGYREGNKRGKMLIDKVSYSKK